MTLTITDRLEGNPEAQASRERYREITRALGEANGAFVARFEVVKRADNTCTMIATSSLGAECDYELCQMALAIVTLMSNIKPAEEAPAPDVQGTAEGEKR